jgi:hypothetical protein
LGTTKTVSSQKSYVISVLGSLSLLLSKRTDVQFEAAVAASQKWHFATNATRLSAFRMAHSSRSCFSKIASNDASGVQLVETCSVQTTPRSTMLDGATWSSKDCPRPRNRRAAWAQHIHRP